MASLSATDITKATFDEVLTRYASLIESSSKRRSTKDGLDTLTQLDEYRLVTVPARLEERRKAGGEDYLEKEEVERLIKWKLKHGKFRPKLLQLVSSNSEAEIKAITQSAFAAVMSNEGDISTALDTLIKLKGVGPASASLLLAVFRPDEVPFFSDEAYRWIMHTGSSSGDWDRPMKYNLKEYMEYLGGVSKVIERLGVMAVDVERVGWVLGREKAAIVGPIRVDSKRSRNPDDSMRRPDPKRLRK